MTDRRTKAQLLDLIDGLEQDCTAWRDDSGKQRAKTHKALAELRQVRQELADRKARDRSPRRLSAARTSCRLQETCKFDALNVVLAWERDGVVEEQKQTILELRQEVEEQEQTILELRREVEEQDQTILELQREVIALRSDKADMIQAKHQFVEEMRWELRRTG